MDRDNASANDNDNVGHGLDDPSSGGTTSVIACNTCRRRKLRCSRELPTCQQCQRIGSDCLYKDGKGKPGMKPGTIETIQRRLDRLEQAFEEHRFRRADACGPLPHPLRGEAGEFGVGSEMQNTLIFLAKELHKLHGSSHAARPNSPPVPGRETVRLAYQEHTSAADPTSPRKRRRLYDDDIEQDHITSPLPSCRSPALPSGDAQQIVISTYFSHIHPWIPMIQESRFRQRLCNPRERPKLELILHAMIVATYRHCRLPGLYDTEEARSWILAKGISTFSVESLQALIIIAFTDIGDGQGARAWSIVGSLTRTAEYLQLTTEPGSHDHPPLLPPSESLVSQSTCPWVEVEERRRVFWNIFNLDRFCSVSMGWNTSLTSNDVLRRLPCDVHLWHKERPEKSKEEIITPYFNIWDKSAARIGNTITFIPSHIPSAPQGQRRREGSQSPLDAGALPSDFKSAIDMSMVGAFAYCVEATESLSRVTTHFLQQKVDLQNPQELSSWLTRFKELDLRLIHWKMLLPQKWKPNMAKQSAKMDPNLTLAHVTHNASIILLHQPIAFPPSRWSFSSRLPSTSSADTCYAAALEIASITRNYLQTSPAVLPLSNQFAFCVYIAARSLLLHWDYYSTSSVAPEFMYMLDSLTAMARRWSGGSASPRGTLATKYATKLRELHRKSVDSDLFHIEVLAYTQEISHRDSAFPLEDHEGQIAGAAPFDEFSAEPSPPHRSGLSRHNNTSHGADASVGEANNDSGSMLFADNGFEVTGSSSLGKVLMDHQFLDMDRVISLQDGMFGFDYEGQGWE